MGLLAIIGVIGWAAWIWRKAGADVPVPDEAAREAWRAAVRRRLAGGYGA